MGKIAILKELFKVIVISCNYIINFFNWQHQHSIITAVNHFDVLIIVSLRNSISRKKRMAECFCMTNAIFT